MNLAPSSVRFTTCLHTSLLDVGTDKTHCWMLAITKTKRQRQRQSTEPFEGDAHPKRFLFISGIRPRLRLSSPDMVYVFPLPVCPYAKIVPLNPFVACSTIGCAMSPNTCRHQNVLVIIFSFTRAKEDSRSSLYLCLRNFIRIYMIKSKLLLFLAGRILQLNRGVIGGHDAYFLFCKLIRG